MNAFKSFFDKLLGNKASQAFPENTSLPKTKPGAAFNYNDFRAEHEKKRLTSIQEGEAAIKDWLIARVKEKGTMNFSWESGNDEALVEFNEYNDAEQEQFDTLEWYIINLLDIPDAGEFKMIGNGSFYSADNAIKLMHSSTLREIVDYDEKTGDEVYGKSDEDKGDILLFTI
ncbi:hypothetical protein [Chitinophaga sancti]|uniref:Uncharacterized protein n=1 Tax=Chitinophaga sancti TaxID=1004 RepID=A0A1K1QMS4_9BACT|nr:hypothetical protein [Chitinophaga sancti]WQD65087.1 hypothetical protein U0033_11845 [Chitinophaga sancti]WQG89289.1 hypothetical protein SR876_30625 [Chitinophaga sancti]SFW61234.1 hypothetical protein SAMN05661012_02948 [Chitinophaga sancti]